MEIRCDKFELRREFVAEAAKLDKEEKRGSLMWGPPMPSYATEAEGNTYIAEAFLDSDAWDNADSIDRDKALAMATRIIDRLNFEGALAVATQANQFPRGLDLVVPDDIKNASIEIAFALLDGVSPDNERSNLSVTAQGLTTAKTSYNRGFAPPYIANGVPSPVAWDILKPYLRDPRGLNMVRTS